ncbi:MAG: hypothetical protein IBX45_12235, partial [Campylobacterales bacterium]|nr:hypothetical protein [Campylobacterales bacterium]
MKGLNVVLVLMVMLGLHVYAADFSKAPTSGKAELIQEGPQKQWCPICGMKL